MNKGVVFIVLGSLIGFFAGCSDVNDSAIEQRGQVTQQFQLLNTRGEPTTTFGLNDTIFFLYRLRNQTSKDLVIGMANGGPLIRFLVQRDSAIIEDSFEGFAFPGNAPSYPFLRSQVIEQRWTLRANSLLQREYAAIAKPQMVVQGEDILSEVLVSFVVQ